jgi:hypothetical protein
MKGTSRTSTVSAAFAPFLGARERSGAKGARSVASGPRRQPRFCCSRDHAHPCTGIELNRSRSAQLSIRALALAGEAT